jgi:hypothetical protein
VDGLTWPTYEADLDRNLTDLHERVHRGTLEAAREISVGTPMSLPAWRLVDSARHIRREIADRVAGLIQTIRSRIDLRAKERGVTREWDLGR